MPPNNSIFMVSCPPLFVAAEEMPQLDPAVAAVITTRGARGTADQGEIDPREGSTQESTLSRSVVRRKEVI